MSLDILKRLSGNMKFINLSGQKFGSLTVLNVYNSIYPAQFLCICECKNKVIKSNQNLKKEKDKSCCIKCGKEKRKQKLREAARTKKSKK